jgi:hypothetical protein
MEKKIRILISWLLLFGLAQTAEAQFILGVQGSYLTGSGDDKKGQLGFGVQGKGKVGNRVAVGGTLRSWIKNYREIPSGSSTVRVADATTQLAGMLEFYFGDRIQPYIGTDAGLYFTNTVFTTGTSTDVNNKKTFFGIGPKAGIQFNTGAVTPFVQAQYNVLFGGGDEITIPVPGGANVNVITHSKFLALDFGILFQIGKVGGRSEDK